WTERPFAQRPSDYAVLTPREAGLLMILQGGASSSLTSVLRLHQPPELFAHGLAAVASLDSMKPALTPHDGMVGVARAHWRMLERHGVSPTALERYAQCPFKYFAEKVLRLEPLETPDSVLVPDARARGTLCHAILRLFYQRLTERKVAPDQVTSSGVAGQPAPRADPRPPRSGGCASGERAGPCPHRGLQVHGVGRAQTGRPRSGDGGPQREAPAAAAVLAGRHRRLKGGAGRAGRGGLLFPCPVLAERAGGADEARGGLRGGDRARDPRGGAARALLYPARRVLRLL